MSTTNSGFTPPSQETVTEGEPQDELEAIAIEDLKYEVSQIKDYTATGILNLPIGVFAEDAKYTEIAVRPTVNTGDFDLYLGELDPQEGEQTKKVVETLASFLGGGQTKSGPHQGAIESIGGIPLKELAIKAGHSSASQLISHMYMGDVATLMFATRLKTVGIDFAIDRQCPVPQCNERCRTMTSIEDVELKSLPDLTTKPLFKYTLETGFTDGAATVKNLYFEPLKLHQLGMFIGGGRVPDVEMLVAMIAAIPESPSSTKRKGRPFTLDMYRRMTQDDIDGARDAANQLMPGPLAFLPVVCACGQQDYNHQLNWARLPREFLYKSKKLAKEV